VNISLSVDVVVILLSDNLSLMWQLMPHILDTGKIFFSPNHFIKLIKFWTTAWAQDHPMEDVPDLMLVLSQLYNRWSNNHTYDYHFIQLFSHYRSSFRYKI